jgi:hypothetical protein
MAMVSQSTAGYHDYQHLVREYKEFTRFTPAEFFQLENLATERFLSM